MNNFNSSVLRHIYRRSADGTLLFHSEAEFLFFVSLVFISAKTYDIKVTGLVIMLNHFHLTCYSKSKESLELFIRQVTSRYTFACNKRKNKVKVYFMCHKKWFSNKIRNSDKRSCYVYLANNSSEKGVGESPLDYYWNFLSFLESRQKALHQISERKSTDSKKLSMAKCMVRYQHTNNKVLTLTLLEDYYSELLSPEWTILRDYILQVYLDIDISDILHYFGSLGNYLLASSAYRGFEYDLDEPNDNENYPRIFKMMKYLEENGLFGNDLSLQNKSAETLRLINRAVSQTGASLLEARRLFHLGVHRQDSN